MKLDVNLLRHFRHLSELCEKIMVITIHQPEHLPWAGFFHKMSLVDKYVLLDNVQYKKNNWQNRNRIITRNGEEQWLTVPVKLKGHIQTTIKEIEINEQVDWRRIYWGRLNNSYCKHPFYKTYSVKLYEIIHQHNSNLRELNKDLIDLFRDILGIKNQLIWASDLCIHNKRTELIIEIVKTLGGETYISGPDGAKYLDLDLFEKENIRVLYHNFSPPKYDALNGFIYGLSTLDIIMNHGGNSASIIGIGKSS